jgi:hypothetical protein
MVVSFAFSQTKNTMSMPIPKEVARAYAERAKLQSKCNWIFEVNYAINSKHPRLFVYSIKDEKLYRYKCAHGGGGMNKSPHDGMCREVSNVPESKCSSLGVMKTGHHYVSAQIGDAIRLHGLSPTNSNILKRLVVFHGGAYVEGNNGKICGRSLGCIVVDDDYMNPAKSGDLIKWLKGGSIGVAHYNGKFSI